MYYMGNDLKKHSDASTEQLNLSINLQLDARISDFAGQSWIPIIDAVRQLHTQLLTRFHVYGALGAGKSHLLTAICESYIDHDKTAIKISLADMVGLPTESLMSLENYDMIALDDLQHIVDYPDWQEAVFHLLNRSEAGRCQLVFTSECPLNEMNFSMPDLASRFAQAPSFKLPEGNLIEDRHALLEAMLERRQLVFDDRITHYLIYHGPAKTGQMIAALNDIQTLFEGIRTKRASTQRLKQAKAIIDQYTLSSSMTLAG